MAENNAAAPEQELSEILKIRREKLASLQQAGKDPFEITLCERTHNNLEIRENFEQLENQTVTIAGRMMSRRDMGKASFIDIRDRYDRMQVYAKIDDLGEETYAELKKWDIGDIISVTGFVFPFLILLPAVRQPARLSLTITLSISIFI